MKSNSSIQPTDIRNFLDEAIRERRDSYRDCLEKRFYILLDESGEQFSRGQQRVINTIIKQRHTTMVFNTRRTSSGCSYAREIHEGVRSQTGR